MTKPVAAIIPASRYDDCRITSCFKRLFTIRHKAKGDLVVKGSVAELRKELELLNTQDVVELSYDYISALEESLPAVSFRYVVIYRDGRPVLFAYFQLFTLTSKNFNFDKDTNLAKRLLHFFLDLKNVSVLISGNALRNDTAAFCYNDDVLSKEEAIELIASAAEKIASDECVSGLVLKDLTASAATHKWLTKEGFETPMKDMVMTMHIDKQWTSIDHYVAALSRKYKTRAKKILASGGTLTQKLLTAADIWQHDKKINQLFNNVMANQSFVLTQPGPNHFIDLKKLYGDDFEVTGIFKGTQLVAFFSAFIDKDAYDVYYVGFDYELNNDHQLYFNLLFAGLQRAIQLGMKQLKLGRTSFDAKASLGATPVTADYYFKPGYIPAVVVRWFARYFAALEDGKWKLRSPLRTS